MNHKNRGKALIINMKFFKGDTMHYKTRFGSLRDVTRLEKVLKNKLKFETQTLNSPTKKKIFEAIDASEYFVFNCCKKILIKYFFNFIVASSNHADNDCLLVVMMTHGGEGGLLEAFDCYFQASELWSKFMGTNCRSLIGKPKLFVLQACRGERVDIGIRCTVTVDAMGSYENWMSVPSSADQLVMYATPEGNVAIRGSNSGSWLIQELCQQLEDNSDDDFLSILTDVNRKVALREVKDNRSDEKSDAKSLNLIGAKQIPIIVHSLTKKIVFRNLPLEHDF